MEAIGHSREGKGGNFYYELDGKKMGEMVYVMAGEQKMIIEHTEVDDSLQGKGVAKQLLEHLIDYVRANNIKVVALCTYANATIKRTKEWHDVLA